MADAWNDYFRRKRQRRDDDPRSDGAVVGSERSAARDVIVELPLDSIDRPRDPAGPVACGEPPAIFAVALKPERVPDGILLLHERRLPAVLEVVAAALAHEGVADPAIDPQVRELVGKSGPE